MGKNNGIISSRRELACPNATQTHSQRARRLNKEKQALTLWNNKQRSGLGFLPMLRLFYYAFLPSLRRFYSHSLSPSHHMLRHYPSSPPQLPHPPVLPILYPQTTTPQSSWRPGSLAAPKNALLLPNVPPPLQYNPLVSRIASTSAL